MSRTLLTLALLTTSSLTLAQSTSLPCWFAPPHVAASVVASAADATTYALACTASCSSIQNGQGTMVNGPSTAAFTQVWLEEGATAQKTLIYDCQVKSADGSANCVVKAGQDGTTGTFSRTSSFKGEKDVVVTAGYEKLGIVIASTTVEVNSTTMMSTTSAPTPKPTHYSAYNTTSASFHNTTSASGSSRSATLLPTTTGSAPGTTSDISAATALNVKGLGAMVALVGGFMAFM